MSYERTSMGQGPAFLTLGRGVGPVAVGPSTRMSFMVPGQLPFSRTYYGMQQPYIPYENLEYLQGALSGMQIWERPLYVHGPGGVAVGPAGLGPGGMPVQGGAMVCVQPRFDPARGGAQSTTWPPPVDDQAMALQAQGCVPTGQPCGGPAGYQGQLWNCAATGMRPGQMGPHYGYPFARIDTPIDGWGDEVVAEGRQQPLLYWAVVGAIGVGMLYALFHREKNPARVSASKCGKWLNFFISPEGKIYPTQYYGHSELEEQLIEEGILPSLESVAIAKGKEFIGVSADCGWMRISTEPRSHVVITILDEPTQKQLDALFDIVLTHRKLIEHDEDKHAHFVEDVLKWMRDPKYLVHINPSKPVRDKGYNAISLDRLGIDWDAVDFTREDLLRGIEVEREHDDVTRGDLRATARIALAHLMERPDYYERLAECVENPENGPVADADWALTHSQLVLGEAAECLSQGDLGCARRKGREAKDLAHQAWMNAPRATAWFGWGRKGIEKRAERQFRKANDFLWDVGLSR